MQHIPSLQPLKKNEKSDRGKIVNCKYIWYQLSVTCFQELKRKTFFKNTLWNRRSTSQEVQVFSFQLRCLSTPRVKMVNVFFSGKQPGYKYAFCCFLPRHKSSWNVYIGLIFLWNPVKVKRFSGCHFSHQVGTNLPIFVLFYHENTLFGAA